MEVVSMKRSSFRRAGLAGGLTAVLLAAGAATSATTAVGSTSPAKLPVSQIEKIEQAQGDYSNGVLAIDIDRSDIHVTGPGGIKFKQGFQIQHELYFQMLGGSTAVFNGDLAVKTSETQRVIDAIEAEGLTFQAEHQHFVDTEPDVWFIHFRGTGSPASLAERVHKVVLATHTALPQTMPKNPTTPLPAGKLAKILGGTATVGENGIVTVDISRTDKIVLGGHRISPDLGVSTSVQFQPSGHGNATVAPDFSMTTPEVARVTRVMRSRGWDDECLYNQEIGESPQLYFSHMLKTGNALTLAQQVRDGLNQTASEK
jgi:uncharacterized protein DUF1259